MSSVCTSGSDRGRRAYQCLRCRGKQYTGPRYRVKSHILKMHLGLDDVPFYCKLCLFRSFTAEELKGHVRSFGRHGILLAEKGVIHDDSMLVANTHPYANWDSDMAPLSETASQDFWKSRGSRTPRVTSESSSGILEEAIQTAFPDGLQPTGPNLGTEEKEADRHAQPATVTPGPSTINLPTTTNLQAAAQGIQQLMSLLGGVASALQQSPCTNTATRALTTPAPVLPAETSNFSGVQEVQALDLSVSSSRRSSPPSAVPASPSARAMNTCVMPVELTTPRIITDILGMEASPHTAYLPEEGARESLSCDDTRRVVSALDSEDVLPQLAPEPSPEEERQLFQDTASEDSSSVSSASSLQLMKAIEELTGAVKKNSEDILTQARMMQSLAGQILEMSHAITVTPTRKITREVGTSTKEDWEERNASHRPRDQGRKRKWEGSNSRPRWDRR